MSLLSGLIVQGTRAGLSNSIAKAISGALGSAAASGLYGNLNFGGGGGASAAQTQSAVDRAMEQIGKNSNTVAPVEVQAPAGAGGVPAGGAAGGALSNILYGGGGGDTIVPGETTVDTLDVQGAAPDAGISAALSPLLSTALSTGMPSEVEGLDITAPPRAPPISEDAVGLPGQVPGLVSFSNPDNVEPVTDEQGPYLDQSMMLAPLAAVGLIPNGAGPTGLTQPGGSFLDGLPIRDLIAAGVLGGGLLAGGGGGGSNADALKDIAKNNQALANRLGNISDAGFQGNIGGKAMNSIRRMVRKAQASIRQRYAGMGLTGSTAETDDLNDAVQAGVEMQFEIGQKMASTGLNAIASLSGQSAQAYLALMNAQTAKDTALGNALANFAGALVR